MFGTMLRPAHQHGSRCNNCNNGSRSGRCSSRSFTKHQPALSINSRPLRRIVLVRVWQQVFDQASGKPYYWNTATNETAWELPPGTSAASTSSSSSSTAVTSDLEQQQQQQQQHQQQQQEPLAQDSMPFDVLYTILQEAYTADGSGMEFWEVARAHRRFGVFEPPFFEYLEARERQLKGVDEAGREMAFKVMCRLSNPLLRQPAPFEF